MSTDLNPSRLHSDWYEELCALAAIGELSSSEFEDLQRHLADCSDCRALCSEFRRLACDDLGKVAVTKRAMQPEQGTNPMDEQALLAHLLDRASRERGARGALVAAHAPVAAKRPLRDRLSAVKFWLREPALSYGSVALILCICAAIGAYRLKEAQLTPTLRGLSSEMERLKSSADTSAAEQKSTSERLQRSISERKSLERALSEARVKYTDLEARENTLESQLSDARSQAETQNQELAAARNDANGKSKQIAELQTRVENAAARTEEQRQIADGLQTKLRATQQSSPKAESQGFGDAEARELFGARDLHIVDVYDVDGSGATKRTYGRVYYVERRLLMFYAFDLQNKGRGHAAVSFQAWGYRQPNENTPENLGLFTVDDFSVNRWVLKVNNPRVLEHIDAVFVTAEGPNGSTSPRGRRLLYANLAGPANHP